MQVLLVRTIDCACFTYYSGLAPLKFRPGAAEANPKWLEGGNSKRMDVRWMSLEWGASGIRSGIRTEKSKLRCLWGWLMSILMVWKVFDFF